MISLILLYIIYYLLFILLKMIYRCGCGSKVFIDFLIRHDKIIIPSDHQLIDHEIDTDRIRDNEIATPYKINFSFKINDKEYKIMVHTNMPKYYINEHFVYTLLVSNVQNLPKIMNGQHYFTKVGQIMRHVMNNNISYSLSAIRDFIGYLQYDAIKNKMSLIDVLKMNINFFASNMYIEKFSISISTNRLKILFLSLSRYLYRVMPNLFIKFQKIFLEHTFEIMPGSTQEIVDDMNSWKKQSYKNDLYMLLFNKFLRTRLCDDVLRIIYEYVF
jgi:hypothetical protein